MAITTVFDVIKISELSITKKLTDGDYFVVNDNDPSSGETTSRTIFITDLAVGVGERLKLNDISNVVVTSPRGGQILRWDGGNWVNSEEDNTHLRLTDFSVVNERFSKYEGGELDYNGTTGQFTFYPAKTTHPLAHAEDVSAETPQDNDTLSWSQQGLQWRPKREIKLTARNLAPKDNGYIEVEGYRIDYTPADFTPYFLKVNHKLTNLLDVDDSNKVNNSVLQYNRSSLKWETRTATFIDEVIAGNGLIGGGKLLGSDGIVRLDVELNGGDDGLEFQDGRLSASTATVSRLGSIKVGRGMSITPDGVLNALCFDDATTTTKGIGYIASISDYNNLVLAVTDNDLNEAGNDFVTPSGLEYWKRIKKLVAEPDETLVLYIVSDEYRANQTSTWNYSGTKTAQVPDPDRNLNTLFPDPPTTIDRAVRWRTAVTYANDVKTSLERVEYRLANGRYYYSPPAFRTRASIVGARGKFNNRNRLAGTFESGGTPTTDVVNWAKRGEMPVFSSRISGSLYRNVKRVNTITYGVILSATQTLDIDGVAWMHAEDQIKDRVNWPDSLYAGSYFDKYRKIYGSQGSQKVIQEWLNANADNLINTSGWYYDRNYSRPVINFTNAKGDVRFRNILLGARSAGRGTMGYGTYGSMISLHQCDLSIQMAGIYLWGNMKLGGMTSTPRTYINPFVYGNRNTQSLINGLRSYNVVSNKISIGFPPVYRFASVPGNGSSEKDFDVNCIHVLQNNGTYGTWSNKDKDNPQKGASFDTLIGPFTPNTQILTGGYINAFFSGWTLPPSLSSTGGPVYSGVAGVFGDKDANGGPISMGTGVNPQKFLYAPSYRPTVWHQARTGRAIVTNRSDLTFSPGKSEQCWRGGYTEAENPINLRTQAFYKGIDPGTGQSTGGYTRGLSDRRTYIVDYELENEQVSIPISDYNEVNTGDDVLDGQITVDDEDNITISESALTEFGNTFMTEAEAEEIAETENPSVDSDDSTVLPRLLRGYVGTGFIG